MSPSFCGLSPEPRHFDDWYSDFSSKNRAVPLERRSNVHL